MNMAEFYRAFEERHRGSRELVARRLEVYLPFIAPLRQQYRPAVAVDLGCGRGEWLELLAGQGFEAQGVDLDAGMLAACTERNLSVTQGDALALLKDLPDESQCVVSGFHIAEHISFDALQTLVVESLRVLKPGGLLILETPNPENLVVGTSGFYTDPTHQRPLPPPLLAFLPEHYGFRRVKIVRLQEDVAVSQRSDIALIEVLAGVSPDYSVVAQKDASAAFLSRFDDVFAAHHGLALDELAGRHDQHVAQRLTACDQRLEHVAQRLTACDQRWETVQAHASGIADAMGRVAVLQDRLIEATATAVRKQARIELLEQRQTHIQRQREDAEAQTQQRQARIAKLEANLLDLNQSAVAAGQRALQLQSTIDGLLENQARLQQQASNFKQLQEHFGLSERQREEAERKVLESQSLLQQQQKRIEELDASTRHWCLYAQALEEERDALRASWSWRVTRPLRAGVSAVTRNKSPVVESHEQQPPDSAVDVVQRPLAAAMRTVLRRPELAYRINQRLLHHPQLHQWLVRVARRSGLMPDMPLNAARAAAPTFARDGTLSSLTPHAREIHDGLRTAITRCTEERS